MSTALSLSALLLSVAAIFAYQWVTFAPWAGLGLLYRIKRVQLLVAAVAWSCALPAYALHPSSGQGVVLLLTAALTPLSGFNNAAGQGTLGWQLLPSAFLNGTDDCASGSSITGSGASWANARSA